MPRFEAGISSKNIAVAADTLKKLDYHGPLALSWDDTDLEQSLSVWDEGKDIWVLLGGTDGPIRVSSASAVDALFDDPTLKKADKVCTKPFTFDDLANSNVLWYCSCGSIS